jgi:Zn-dependent M28 family amino/carboxypeptidase
LHLQTNPETIAQVEVIYQNPSGAMDFHFMHSILTNVYTNLTNVLVRLSWGEASKKDAILVNSHFDTPVESPGATDDRSCVAMMLELARAASYHKMDHALILLFNGAEESLQEGSHGFITQHEWAKTLA